MTADDQDEAPPPGLATQHIVAIGILVLIGLGVTAYELLGLSPDDFGGMTMVIGGVIVFALALKLTLQR
ncbi:hypothetical protein ACVFYP_05925 [Roseomonas sp. F4]